MSDRTRALKKDLRRIESDEPADIRLQIVQTLLDHSPAEFAFFVRYAVRQGELFHSSFTVAGDETARGALIELEGTPSVSSPCWSPWSPRPVERQRFVSLNHGPVSKETLAQSEGYRVVYQPFGIEDHARILLYDGTRFLGWLGLMRGEHRAFDRTELKDLNRLVGEVSAALSAAEDLEAGQVGDGFHLVVDPRTLKVEWASRGARAWLAGPRAERLETLVRGFRRGEASSVASIDGHEVRAVELAGDDGVRYHVHIAATELPQLAAGGLLSPRQLEVAQYAAAGAKTGEIAGAMGLSRHTVADHLKAIYSKLGIGSRAELAACLARRSR